MSGRKESTMRALLLTLGFSVLALFPGQGYAEDRLAPSAISNSAKQVSTIPNSETYRGHYLDLAAIVGRQDFAAMAETLRHQIDLVEDVPGLSPRTLEFFRTIPISVNDVACLTPSKDQDGKDLDDPKALLHDACYGLTSPEGSHSLAHGSVWDSRKSRWTNTDPVALGEDTDLGVIMVRPIMLTASSKEKNRPVMLHELLHAYHNLVMPQGYRNAGILMHYNAAKAGKLYPAGAYLLTNVREFFAVTASVFLHGDDGAITRVMIKEKQPDYYHYLVWLFGFDPDPTPSLSPMASAE
jgi:hypothetical protein